MFSINAKSIKTTTPVRTAHKSSYFSLNICVAIYVLRNYHVLGANRIWWLCLVPTSTGSPVIWGAEWPKISLGYTRKIIFMYKDIKFLNIEWRTRYSLANFEDHFGLHGSVIFSCDQAALWMVQSVRPSVCLSVTHFSLCSHHCIIMKFSGVITNDRSDVHTKGHGQMTKVKVTEVKTQLGGFRTITPVWIHVWQWNDAHSFMWYRQGALLFFKVIRQISRSHS